MQKTATTKQDTPTNYKLLYDNGDIASWYLYPQQQSLYNLCYSGVDVVTKCHRRYGKDSVVLTYAAERATSKSLYLIRYGAPTLKQAYEITDFIFTKIYDKDSRCKPKYNQKGFWDFGNDSKMTLFGGADSEEVEKGRGVEANLIILSEYAFFKYRPKYLLQEVLSPQLVTTHGQKIIVSTVPEDLTHQYVHELRNAEADKRAFIWTIEHSLRVGAISEEQHKKIIKDCGGVDSDAYKREYLCQLVPSTAKIIIPEMQDDKLDIIQTRERPECLTPYSCADLGLHDFSVSLFGYHDFKDAILYIEYEHKANYTTTRDKVNAWREIERIADYRDKYTDKPYTSRRFSDNDAQQIFDLNNDYKYPVNPVMKRHSGDNPQDRLSFAESVINKLRIGLKQGKVKIHPRCTFLISTLKYGIWNDKRTDFERSEELGHFDAGICLAYLYDNVDFKHNPYPLLTPDVKPSTHYIDYNKLRKQEAGLRLMMGKK